MKLRSTTPVSMFSIRKVSKAFVLFGISALLVIGTVPIFKPAAADQYDDQIAALTSDMAKYQAEANRLNGEAATLANAVAQLTNEKNALQAQIDLNQTQSDQLVLKIADTTKQISDNQDALGKTIADLYIDDGTSPIEMLASSTNIGDFLNKQEYRSSVKTQLNDTILKVKTLKAQLDTQKSDLDKVLTEQKNARDDLAAKESAQQSLLSQTQNDESNYQNLIKNSSAAIASAKAAQAALYARQNSTGGYQLVDAGSLGAYGWDNSSCPMVGYLSTGGTDGNGSDGHGYGCRQCASYVAWRIAKETGIYYQWGNGGNFASAAINAGYQNLGRSPQPGSVAVLLGNPGHVAWVEGVSPDGSHVTVSQYNYNYGSGWGMYSEMVLSSSFFDQYVKIK
ncbi:MAG TPA: CHAP domain-containing protein [Candidatus Microsaccharimonas sp.]